MNIIKIFMLLLVSSFTASAQLPANLDRQFMFSATDPITVRHAGDETNRLFIAEQAGTIKVYDGSLLATNFLDISSKVASGGERGLLGLDFDPNFANNGYFYVNYTKSGANFGDTIIERYTVSANNPNIADVNSAVVIMRIDQPFNNHNGGDIHFGPDGYLYIGMGDGGGAGDPDNYAQRLDNLLGKMLRIEVLGDFVFNDSFEPTLAIKLADNRCGLDSSINSYRIPDDNPFVNDANSCAEIWSYGLRNPYRWSFDRLTGDMIIGDVGQNAFEEIDFQLASNTGGDNYGWRCREAANDFDTSQCTGSEVFVEPVIEQELYVDSRCSIMGGYIYRGSIAALQGLYLFSDFCGGKISFATPSAGTWAFEEWQDADNNIGFGTRGFGEDEQGEIYHIYNNYIYKIILN